MARPTMKPVEEYGTSDSNAHPRSGDENAPPVHSRSDPHGPLGLARAYFYGVVKPTVATYRRELQYASALRLLAGLAVAGIFAGLTDLGPHTYDDPVNGWFGQLEFRGTGAFKTMRVEIPWLAAVLDVLLVFATFFLGASWLRIWASRMGRGRTTSTNLTGYCYALSISYVPLHIVLGLLLWAWFGTAAKDPAPLPLVPLVLSLGLFTYQLYCASVALQVTHSAPVPGSARLGETSSAPVSIEPTKSQVGVVVMAVVMGLLSIVVLTVVGMVLFFIFIFRLP